jgi:hypothetical protein
MSAAMSGRHMFADGNTRPMRNGPPLMTSTPDIGQPPAVWGLNGFGAGAGAYIRNQGRDADRSQGLVVIRCGLNPAATGVLQLSFPAGIVTGQYVLLADWCTFALVVAAPVLQANWTATRTLGQETLLVAYQWTVST